MAKKQLIMSKEYKLGVNTIIAIKVPEGATDFGWRCETFTCKIPGKKDYKWLVDADELMHKIGGVWEVLGRAKDITEEQANGLAVAHGTWAGKYKSYSTYSFSDANTDAFFDAHRWANTALESFHSWLTANGIDKDDLILKKE